MNAIVNENRLCYCDLCDKAIVIESKPKYLNSKSHKHKKIYSILVREDKVDKPLVHKISSIFDKCIRDCHVNIPKQLNKNVYTIIN